MILTESNLAKIRLPKGEYLRKVVAIDNSAIFDESKIVLLGASKLDIIILDTYGLSESKCRALPNEIFNVEGFYFKPAKDRLSVEITGNKMDRDIFENFQIPEKVIYAGYAYFVTGIGDRAFEGYSSLNFVTISHSVTSIGDGAFCGCSSLISMLIPNCVKSIGEYVFSECISLSSINIADSVTNIGDEAFCGCSSLRYITLPNSIKSIGNKVFCACSSLGYITIPNSVTSIGEEAFCYCSSLRYITIPDSVTSIGNKAFYGCSSLTMLDYAGTREQWKKMEKSEGWNENSNIQIIRCTDGEVNYN